MDNLRQYLLTVICVSAVCAIVVGLIGKNGSQAAIMKLISGIFITITVISPWLSIQFHDISYYFDSLYSETQTIVDSGMEYSDNETTKIIKERVEEYIHNKASSLGSALDIEVILSESEPYKPISITLTGGVSPYNKRQLQQIISDDLGIPEVDQEWN